MTGSDTPAAAPPPTAPLTLSTVKVSVIIPVYNEENHIREVLDAVHAVDLLLEVIVVDDCSTDSSHAVLDGYESAPEIRIVRHDRNQGKGAAIRTGIAYATGDIVLIQDADTEYDTNDYPALIAPIVHGTATVVYGSRFLGTIEGMAGANRVANRLLTVAANVLYQAKITDEATCYKVFRADVIQGMVLNAQRFEFCPEVTAKVRKAGHEITEVPISYVGRTRDEGKKISWRDGFVALWTLVRYRVSG